jgi:hypothetical protein
VSLTLLSGCRPTDFPRRLTSHGCVTNVAGVSICDRACIIVKLSSVTRRCYACVGATPEFRLYPRHLLPFALCARFDGAKRARRHVMDWIRREFGNGARARARMRACSYNCDRHRSRVKRIAADTRCRVALPLRRPASLAALDLSSLAPFPFRSPARDESARARIPGPASYK